MTRKSLVVLAVALLLLAAAAPAVTGDESTLSVAIEQANDGHATVTVERNGTAVENASVDVSTADGNDTYAGTGEYSTDDNGTVRLPAPEEDVTVEVSAEADGASGSTTAELAYPWLRVEAQQDAGAAATVSVTYTTTGDPADGATVNVSPVDGNATYVGTGSYTSDEDGTVELPAPAANVTVEVDAYRGDQSGGTTVDLLVSGSTSDGNAAFGDRVSAIVHWLQGQDREGGIGRAVAEFVTGNNPGNAPDHAGPPENGSNGPGETGPPDHAGNDDGPGDDESSESADENAGASNAGGNGDRGPPEHAGSGNGKSSQGPNGDRGPPN